MYIVRAALYMCLPSLAVWVMYILMCGNKQSHHPTPATANSSCTVVRPPSDERQLTLRMLCIFSAAKGPCGTHIPGDFPAV